MSDFVAGLSARHDAAAVALHAAFQQRPTGFAPADLIARIDAAVRADDFGPRHFHPADRATNPTDGWDPLDPTIAPDTQFHDPVADARAAGYAEGVAEASAAAGARERDRALVAALAETLADARWIDRDRLAQQLRQTVLLLVTRLVGEVGVAPDHLARRITAAIDLLADAAESAILRVHPDDVALLADKLPAAVFPVGDATVARGAFVLEAASTIVEDGPAAWLDQLAHAIDHVPLTA